MPKWDVSAKVVATKYIGEFEADTAEEAIEKAEQSDQAYVSVCHQCADDVQDPECAEFEAALVPETAVQ